MVAGDDQQKILNMETSLQGKLAKFANNGRKSFPKTLLQWALASEVMGDAEQKLWMALTKKVEDAVGTDEQFEVFQLAFKYVVGNDLASPDKWVDETTAEYTARIKKAVPYTMFEKTMSANLARTYRKLGNEKHQSSKKKVHK